MRLSWYMAPILTGLSPCLRPWMDSNVKGRSVGPFCGAHTLWWGWACPTKRTKSYKFQWFFRKQFLFVQNSSVSIGTWRCAGPDPEEMYHRAGEGGAVYEICSVEVGWFKCREALYLPFVDIGRLWIVLVFYCISWKNGLRICFRIQRRMRFRAGDRSAGLALCGKWSWKSGSTDGHEGLCHAEGCPELGCWDGWWCRGCSLGGKWGGQFGK